MPELPEVETVVRGLQQTIAGSRIRRVVLRRANLRTPFPADFTRRIKGASVLHIHRRAKYLLMTLDNGNSILAHLGMSGRFLIHEQAPARYAAHDHVVFFLHDGRVLVYHDPRRFGMMDVVSTDALGRHRLLSSLGPEPLSKDFSARYLRRALAHRHAPIKTALMDQSIVVGVGNIYASEALFAARIHPETPAWQAAEKAALLVRSVRKVLCDAIASGGSSLRDFVRISGETGYFQHRFNVYGRAGKPCHACDATIRSLRQAGRSGFYCPRCQRAAAASCG